MKNKLLSLLFLFISVSLHAQQQYKTFYKKRPAVFTPVNDYANILTKKQRYDLTKVLKKFRDSTDNVLVLITQSSLTDSVNNETYSVEEAALHYFNNWQIGDKEKNNGVLLFVAFKNRKLRICTGKGIDDILTDESCQSIIDDDIVPNFKQHNYYDGINTGLESIMKILSPDTEAEVSSSNSNANSPAVTYSYSNNNPRDESGLHFPGNAISIFIAVIGIAVLIRIVSSISGGGSLFSSSGSYSGPRRRNGFFGGWNSGNNYHHHYNSDYHSGFSDNSSSFSSSDSSSSSSSDSSQSSGSDSSFGGGSSDGGGASGSW